MNTIKEEQHIAGLILKERTLGLNPAEKQELTAWRASDPANEQIYIRMHGKDFRENIEKYKRIDTVSGLKRYHKQNRRIALLKRTRWAAAAMILIAFGIAVLLKQPETPSQEYVNIVPGSSKAQLILDNGQVINLSEQAGSEIILAENLKITNEGNRIDYTGSDNLKTNHPVSHNELRTPKGGEFSITLSDGTKVWINSETKFRYPVTFGQDSRKVYLEGEAYFEVKKDTQRPFLITTRDDIQVEVLGTSFNVRSYPDEQEIATVLEEGSVKMTHDKEYLLLTPGEKATYRPGEKMQIETVDTDLYTSWRYGQYVFKQENMENILKQLARWYDIEVIYKDESIKSLLFSGSVEKYDNINSLLEAMAIVGKVNFNISGKTLTVSYQK